VIHNQLRKLRAKDKAQTRSTCESGSDCVLTKIWFFFPLLHQFYGKLEYIGNLQNIKAIIVMGRIFFYDLRLILTRGSLKDLSLSLLKNEVKVSFNIMDYVDDKQKFENNKEEIVKYCFQDARLVYLLVQNLHTFFMNFLNDINLLSTSFSIFQPTLSLLALSLWKKITQNTFAILQGVTSPLYDDFIRSSYKGGMCLNIQKYCKGPIFHYDIVSSYPHIMKNYCMPIKIKEHKNYKPIQKNILPKLSYKPFTPNKQQYAQK
jgi:DNA polymerase elongation subunit (family B)